MKPIKNTGAQVRLPLLLSLAIAGGILLGATMFGGQNNRGVLNGYKKFGEILGLIERDYVDTVNTEDLIESAIQQMLENLDPHTVYIPSRDVEMAQTQLEGDFEGIGIEFLIVNDTIQVVSPITDGPSERVGLQAGDKIIAVDGDPVAGVGFTNRDVFDKLRGPKSSKVKVAVQRRGEPSPLDFVITRDKIPSYSIDVAYMIDRQTGYIKVSRFAANTYNEFKQSLEELRAQGMQRMILDLRDNPGGYMDRATKMADEFLSGNKLIVYADGRGERYDSKAFAYRQGMFEEGAVIVLINEGSASASEIVAGALQDNDRALIVGRRSYGKGLVQMPVNLTDGSELRLTIARYYTPSGRSVQKS
ncbi:MAG: S41 family peptidase, partial [Catalinimonas sp.]